MALRDEVSDLGVPSVTSVANVCEVVALVSTAVIILSVATFGLLGAFLGFTMSMAVMFGNVILGTFLFGLSFFVLSLLLGLIENTYLEEETLPEQAADEEQDMRNQEPRRPQNNRV